MAAMDDALDRLRIRLREFSAAREWEQFHSPKNLAIALSVEVAELLEHFQWLPDKVDEETLAEKMPRIEEELADVLLYTIRFADVLGIDLAAASERKIALNESKYPVEKARGSSRKYTEL